jgi:hypothetical protein
VLILEEEPDCLDHEKLPGSQNRRQR